MQQNGPQILLPTTLLMKRLLEKIYGASVALRNYLYDSGRLPVYLPPIPVISIGNLSTGGAGKTPAVHVVAEMVKRMGKTPVVVLRGYGRKGRGQVIVCDGRTIRTTVSVSGDEAMLHAQTLQTPVIADAMRERAIQSIKTPDAVVILDDGFQHRRCGRNLDIVLVDEHTMRRPHLLPTGALREPLGSLRRADIVVLTSPSVRMREVALHVSRDTPIIRAQTQFSGFRTLALHRAVQILPGTRIWVLSAIAQPHRFVRMLEEQGYIIVGRREYRDHHRYKIKDITGVMESAVAARADVVVTTTKDAVKIQELLQDSVPVVPLCVATISVRFDPEAVLESYISKAIHDKEYE